MSLRAVPGGASAAGRSTAAGGGHFDVVFEQLYPQLFRYLHRLTGDTDLAEDVAQESFVRYLGREMPVREAHVWLVTVATNLVRDVARRGKRRRTLLEARPVMPAALPRPDEEAERAERVRAVQAALADVPERDRQILLMRHQGFSYDEIAHAVGVSPASVGTLLARATRRFAKVYGQPEPDE